MVRATQWKQRQQTMRCSSKSRDLSLGNGLTDKALFHTFPPQVFMHLHNTICSKPLPYNIDIESCELFCFIIYVMK